MKTQNKDTDLHLLSLAKLLSQILLHLYCPLYTPLILQINLPLVFLLYNLPHTNLYSSGYCLLTYIPQLKIFALGLVVYVYGIILLIENKISIIKRSSDFK